MPYSTSSTTSARRACWCSTKHTPPRPTASKYALDSLTTKAIRDLSGRFENRLFLSATPHNGHSNSFSALLEMLDPQRFLRGTVVSGPEQLAPVMVRRLKSDLIALGTTGFPQRRLVQIDLVHQGSEWQAKRILDDTAGAPQSLGRGAAAELELSTLLARYTDLACPAKGRGRLVFINLQKRLLSSVEAFARTLDRHTASIGAHALASGDGFELEETDDGDGLSSDAEDAQNELAVAAATAGLAPPPDAAQLLERMRRIAQARPTRKHAPSSPGSASINAQRPASKAPPAARARAGRIGASSFSPSTDTRKHTFASCSNPRSRVPSAPRSASACSTGGCPKATARYCKKNSTETQKPIRCAS